MSDHSVDRDKMQEASGQIDSTAGAIKQNQSNLQGQIQGLIGSGWEGTAAQAFMRGFNEFDSQFNEVQKALVEIHSKMTHSKMQYSATEAENEATTNEIQSALNDV